MENDRKDTLSDIGNKAKNERDVIVDLESQKKPESELGTIFPSHGSDNFNAINNQNQNPKKDNLMPNPDDFDEGDDEDSEGKGARTPGL